MPPNPKQPPPPAVTPKPPIEDEDPIVYSVGIARTSKGWVSFQLATQGNRVIDRELLDDSPTSRVAAFERLKIRAAQRFLLGDPAKGLA